MEETIVSKDMIPKKSWHNYLLEQQEYNRLEEHHRDKKIKKENSISPKMPDELISQWDLCNNYSNYDQMDDKTKFIFVTGVPGSSWSMISHRLKLVLDLDLSDVSVHREFTLPKLPKRYKDLYNRSSGLFKSHFGCYFGPYNEFGGSFDNIKENYTLAEFYNECRRPFTTNDKIKCVRSHWFSYNLDWLWENCKNQYLFLIYKDSELAKNWWLDRGGWNIDHPNYTWYENTEKLSTQIQIENTNLLNFAKDKNLIWEPYDENYWREKFGKEENQHKFRPPIGIKGEILVIYTKII